MSQELIDHNEDLKRLQSEGFSLDIKEGYLLVHDIPYVSKDKNINYASFISNLELAGNKTVKPQNHVLYFTGDYPCNDDGLEIGSIRHSDQNITVGGLLAKFSFSNKPSEGYNDYYHKITTYYNIISSFAKAIDENVKAEMFRPIKTVDNYSVFKYTDTNSSRSNLGAVNMKIKDQKIGIIGLGGTGSFILDLVSKADVKEIRIFDNDEFLQHNAFRIPGAISLEELNNKPKKVSYLKEIYTKIHSNISSHETYIDQFNIESLKDLDFVFVCVDNGESRKIIVEKLIEYKIPFIDTGIGVDMIDTSLRGSLRVTLVDSNKNEHVKNRIPFLDSVDIYQQNIQIAELNSLNASLAVIKWKKLYGFYHDLEKEYNLTYNIDVSQIVLDENNS